MEVFGSEPYSKLFQFSSNRFSSEQFEMFQRNSVRTSYNQSGISNDLDDSSSDTSSSAMLPFPEPVVLVNQEMTKTMRDLQLMKIPGFSRDRTRRSAPPTLATGRRSKFIQLEGEAAVKRDQRRRRNREAARKLKDKRMLIEKQLEKAIQDLEDEEHELLAQVTYLQHYKNHLHRQFQQIERPIPSPTFNIHRKSEREKIESLSNHIRIEDKPLKKRSRSPQWHVLFGI